MAERLATIPYVDSKFNPSIIMENLSSGFVLNTITGSRLDGLGDNFLKDGELLDIDDYPNSKIPYDYTSKLELDGDAYDTDWFVYDGSILFYDEDAKYLRNGANKGAWVVNFPEPEVGMIDSSICSIEYDSSQPTIYYHTYNMKTSKSAKVKYTDYSLTGESTNRFIWFDYYSKCHYLHHSKVNGNVPNWVLKFSPSGIQKINYNPPSTWPMRISMFGNLWITTDNDNKYSTDSGNTWTAIPSSLNIYRIVQGWSPNNIIVCERSNIDNNTLELYRYTNFPTSKTKIVSYHAFSGVTINSVNFGGFTQDGKMIIGLRFSSHVGSGGSGTGQEGFILVSPNGEVSNLYKGRDVDGAHNNAFNDHTIYSPSFQAKYYIVVKSNTPITKLTKI